MVIDEIEVASASAMSPVTHSASVSPPKARAATRPISNFPASSSTGAANTKTAFNAR